MMGDVIPFPEREPDPKIEPEPVYNIELTVKFVATMPHWQCDCGNFFFNVGPEGVFCPCCGLYARF